MIPRSHGAVHSFNILPVRLHSFRPMRHSHVGRGANGVGTKLRCCCHRRFFTTPSHCYFVYRGYLTMATPKTSQKVWHVSHGIVFAGDSRVVYPRLPVARYHSAPAAVSTEGNPFLQSGDRSHGEHSAGRSADGAPARAATSSTTSATAHAAATSTPVTASVTSTTPQGSESIGHAVQGSAAEVADESKPLDPGALHPPFTPLDFKIPVAAFQRAKLAAEGTPESFWSYSLYRGPGTDGSRNSKVKVHYCTSHYTTERVLKQYFMNEKVLGFDLEWSPSATKFDGARKNVSLVQLASPSRIGLFHLAIYPSTNSLVAPSLRKIMEDPGITKTGVWIKGDCSRLKQFLAIDARGTFELSHLYKLVKYSRSGQYELINKHLVSLARQAEDCFELPMYKGGRIRLSDWSKALRMSQIIYSSSDAYAAVQLYSMLDHQRRNLKPTPPLPYHAELNLPIRLAEGVPKVATAADEADPDLETAASEAAASEDSPPIPEANYYKPQETVDDSVSLEADLETDPSRGHPSDIRTKPLPTTTAAAKTKAKDPRVEEASVWATQFRLAHPKACVARSSLRAYYLWHRNPDLGPADVAALLRDPPLQTATVVNYILEGIRLAGRDVLPFDGRRLKGEVLGLVPAELLAGRYKRLARACESWAEWEAV